MPKSLWRHAVIYFKYFVQMAGIGKAKLISYLQYTQITKEQTVLNQLQLVF